MAWKSKICDKCGKEEVRVQVYGKHKDRDYKLSTMRVLCEKCEKEEAKEIEEKRKSQNQEAAKKNQDAGLPELQGSEKQIAWAESLRKELLETIEASFERYQKKLSWTQNVQKVQEKIQQLESMKEEWQKATSAAWIIDNRSAIYSA